MKHSIYNHKIEYKENYYIYNTYTSSIIKMSEEEYRIFKNLNLNTTDLNTLKEQGIIVNDDLDEFKRTHFELFKNSIKNETATFRIYTTDACNAQCFYCYEKDKTSSFMSIETMNKTIDFIKLHTNGIKDINICWFGGEPLLNRKIIDYFYEQISNNEYFKEKSIKNTIITNASLIDNDTVNSMISKWNIQEVQITLDGTQAIHNKRKHYINNLDGFSVALNAICMLAKYKLKVYIRLNYDKNNFEDILRLLEQLSSLKQKYPSIIIYSYPLFSLENNNSKFLSTSEIQFCESKIHDYMYRYGIRKYSVPHKKSCSCFASMEKGFAIDPIGDVYKCPMVVGNNKYKIGTVFDTAPLLSKEYFEWLPITISPKCQTCYMFPICLGGCKAKGMLHLEHCTILKEYLDDEIINYIIKKEDTNMQVLNEKNEQTNACSCGVDSTPCYLDPEINTNCGCDYYDV